MATLKPTATSPTRPAKRPRSTIAPVKQPKTARLTPQPWLAVTLCNRPHQGRDPRPRLCRLRPDGHGQQCRDDRGVCPLRLPAFRSVIELEATGKETVLNSVTQ